MIFWPPQPEASGSPRTVVDDLETFPVRILQLCVIAVMLCGLPAGPLALLSPLQLASVLLSIIPSPPFCLLEMVCPKHCNLNG